MLSTINTGGGLSLNEVGKSNPGGVKAKPGEMEKPRGVRGRDGGVRQPTFEVLPPFLSESFAASFS